MIECVICLGAPYRRRLIQLVDRIYSDGMQTDTSVLRFVCKRTAGGVAQRLEQATHNRLVGGSNPSTPISHMASGFKRWGKGEAKSWPFHGSYFLS